MLNLHFPKSQKSEAGLPRYVALIHKDKGSSYGVMFPDFPGCISAGDTPEEAIENAKEALALHVEGMRQDKEVIPLPRFIEAIRGAREDWVDFKGAHLVTVIPLLPPKGDNVRININIDSNLLEAADKAAKRTKQTRSAFIARALETVLDS